MDYNAIMERFYKKIIPNSGSFKANQQGKNSANYFFENHEGERIKFYFHHDVPWNRFTGFYYEGKKSTWLTIFQQFTDHLREEKVDAMVFRCSESPYAYFSTGKASDLFVSMLNALKDVQFDYGGNASYENKRMNGTRYLEFDFKNKAMHFKKRSHDEITSRFNYEKEHSFFSLKELECYLQQQEDYFSDCVEAEKEFLPLIHQYDKTAYFDKSTLRYRIFGKDYSLYIKKNESPSGNTRYMGRFNGKSIQSSNVNSIKDKMKEQIKDFLLKNRLQAVISGNAIRYIETFLFEVFGKKIRLNNFNKRFDTRFTEGELNQYVKDKIHKTSVQLLSADDLSHFKAFFKENKIQNKIINGYKYDDLFILSSATKIHIYKKNELPFLKS